MLFTFSRFQLICLNAPHSSPKKKAPASPQARTTRGEERAANAAAAPRCQINRSLFSISFMRSICRYIHESDTPTPSVLRNEKGQDAGLTSPGLEWHHVREPCLADVPSVGLFFHFFQRREWQGWFLKAASWSTPSPHLINVLYCARAPGSNINTYTHRPGTLCELSAHRGLISSGLEREAAVFELLICIKETAFI